MFKPFHVDGHKTANGKKEVCVIYF